MRIFVRQFLWWTVAVVSLVVTGLACQPVGDVSTTGAAALTPQAKALAAEQRAAYPPAAGGKFKSLADFEPRGSLSAARQVKWFTLYPASPRSSIAFTRQAGRTGKGSARVCLDVGGSLVFHLPDSCDISAYTLLLMAVHSSRLRDDLCVSLSSDDGEWTSARSIVKPGWNMVLIDIHRLGRLKKKGQFDAKKVRTIRLEFVDAAGPVEFLLDDVLLVNNFRRITPVPEGIRFHENGLDYSVKLPGREGTVWISRRRDGLWRMGVHQPTVKVAGPDTPLAAGGEQIALLGSHRVGQVRVVEHNAVRLRLVNTWYFPSRAGEWAMLGVRYVRWHMTFYADGRWVNDVEMNNAGGRLLGKVSIAMPGRAAGWAGGKMSRIWREDDFVGPVAHWNYILAPTGPDERIIKQNYLSPVKIETIIATKGVYGQGDKNRDGFDESQGCYVLAGWKGHCRFRIHPDPVGLIRPVFRIFGPWKRPPSVNMEGLVVRNVVLLPDGTAMFVLPGKLEKSTTIEVFGEFAPPKVR
ncbi:MAG: hypothetical protein K8S55_14250 [Phycisphaerae bacterium]|nr:hypothetical protein [Phycisphaerae bacterium]